MEAIINFFTGTLNTVAWLYIFLPCTIVGGLYLTIRNRGIQFTRFGYAMKNTVGKMFQKQEAGAGAVTPLQAVTTALAATVGTGNIVGTSQAIALGGYGAVFWLWLAALLGMMIKYSEVTLSIQYRERDAKGDWVGGPMYYIEMGLGKKWKPLAVAFAIFGIMTAMLGSGTTTQMNAITASVQAGFGVSTYITCAVITVLVAIITFGGLKSISKTASKIVPAMAVVYFIVTVIFLGLNAGELPHWRESRW
ncbi:sodium:alanine symporter family protein, partial [bacterium]|nr:sodium:alanine symporter family protein [bacterium]